LSLCLLGLWPLAARAQHTGHVNQDAPSAAAMNEAAVTANSQMADDPFMAKGHVELTPLRPRNPADSARAAATVQALRKTLSPYRDVQQAERDGYQLFAPDVPGQRVYHFNNYAYAMANDANFDSAHPTSLLYRKTPEGEFVLEGAMFTAPADLPLDSLDARVPLSVARWHRHVNFCLPPAASGQPHAVTETGTPVFGPRGVATRAECEAAGGRFVPIVFGWMVHVTPFASTNPYLAFAGGHTHAH